MNFQKQLNDLIVGLYSTNFENGDMKLSNFLENNPGILEDSGLRRTVSLLSAECAEQHGDTKKSLDIYLKIWEEYSIQTPVYLSVGLTITQLYIKLSETEKAVRFGKNLLKAIEIHGFQNHDLVIGISLLRIVMPTDERDPTVHSFIHYIKTQLGKHTENSLQSNDLEEMENKLRQEGQILTQIMATTSSTSKESILENLGTFLATAINPAFRIHASNYYNYLRSVPEPK